MPKLKVIKKLGAGSYGAAFLVMDTATQEYFVMKEIDVSEMPPAEIQDCKKEVQILARMNHPNITAYRRSFLKRGYLVIVMEYADGGDMSMLIKKRRKMKKYFSENQVLDWFTQTCLAIRHIHSKNILHRDLKTQNVFLTSDGLVKLGDFGISRVLDSTVGQASTMVGTPYYLSPEMVSSKPYGKKTDIWALGVSLYEMLTLKVPFTADSLPELADKIKSGKYNSIPGHYSEDAANLLRMLLTVDPMQRPSIAKVLEHPALAHRLGKFEVEILEEEIEVDEEKDNLTLESGGDGVMSNSMPSGINQHDKSYAEIQEEDDASSDDEASPVKSSKKKMLKDCTHITKAGWLSKRSRHIRRWRTRYVVLEGGSQTLLTFKTMEPGATATEEIPLVSFNIVSDSSLRKFPHALNVSNGSRTFSFDGASKGVKQDWKIAIQRAIDDAEKLRE